MPPLRTAVLCLLALAPTLAHAQLDCIVPTREEAFDAKRPGAEALRRAARAAAEIVQKNAVFMNGNKPVRVRTSISYYGTEWLSASVITTAYNEKAWLAGGCKISKFADRGGGLSDGKIVVFIDDPHSMLGGQLGAGELQASFAPKPSGNFRGFPVYAAGGDERDPRVLLSEPGYRPWVAVSVAEMLAWKQRELAKDEAEFTKAQQQSANGLDEQKIEEMYRSLQKLDPVAAEKTRAKLLASLDKTRADAARQSAAGTQAMTKRRAAFDAYRASLTPAQLAAPGTISGTTTREGAIRVDDPAGRPLARVDPAFAKRDANGVRLITVSIAPQPKSDPEYAWQQASYEALDVAALARLLRN